MAHLADAGRHTLAHTNLHDAELDRLVGLARRLTGADTALITLVDDHSPSPLARQLSALVAAAGEAVVVEDAGDGAPAGAYAAFPLRAGDGHVVGALCAVARRPLAWSAGDCALLEDLADTAASLIALRDTAERSVRLAGQYAVVAHAARAIGELGGDDAIFERLADLAVVDLAEMCVVDLLRDGRLEQVAAAPRDPVRGPLHAERAALLAEAGSDHPAFVALSTARTQHVGRPPHGAVDAAELDLYRRLCVGPALLVPLIFHGAPLGVVSLARRRGAPDFTAEDVAVAEAVAHQLSAALSAERLVEEHRNVSGLLQRTLLPPELPAIPGLGVATWYEAGEGEMEVGGDFYDVMQRPDGSWMLVIGDVCGRGPAAAAMTGVVRHTLRGLVALEADLPSAIGELNRRLYEETALEEFVTLAAVGVDLDREEGPVLQATLAGHPAPMVISRDGDVSTVGRPGLPLGLAEDAEYQVFEEAVTGGDALVMYTDGLTEAHGGRTRFDGDALASLLSGCAGMAAPDIVGSVQRGLFAAEGESVSDDVAVMAAQLAVTG